VDIILSQEGKILTLLVHVQSFLPGDLAKMISEQSLGDKTAENRRSYRVSPNNRVFRGDGISPTNASSRKAGVGLLVA
jgi:hypothetical protein